MRVAHDPRKLPPARRVAVVGDFDGVHVGHRELLAAARREAVRDGRSTVLAVVVEDPRTDELLTTVERRLELLAGAGADEALVVEAVPGRDLLATLDARGVDAAVEPAESQTALVRRHLTDGRVREAAGILGRPAEVEGVVVGGDARGTGLGYPTANLDVAPRLLVPANGIYAGAALGHRAAISIGTNPHYGGEVRRVEAFLLDFQRDLYGKRLLVELWQRLREERAFPSEAELVAQIDRDVEATRAATRPE